MATDANKSENRQIRFFTSVEEQEAENIRYWNERTAEEKLRGTNDIIQRSGRMGEFDGISSRSVRSLVRLPCPWS